MTNHPTLVSDIGGTNARFALSHADKTEPFSDQQNFSVADYDGIADALSVYLENQNISQLDGICLAVAGPILDDKVSFLNSHWQIDCGDIRARFNTDKVKLLNDWEAIAFSLNHLSSSDLIDLAGPWKTVDKLNTNKNFTLGAIGPGSGLGVSALCRRGDAVFPLITEGGHAGFSPDSLLQSQILDYLRNKFGGRISNERLLSGPGLVNIYEAICDINGHPNQGLTASEIATSGTEKSDPICEQTFSLFFEVLGQAAGDLALMIDGRDGIFIAGGIAQRYPQQLASSQFRAGFENKGRHSALMQTIPTWLVSHKNPGLLGASIYANTYL